MLLIIITCIRLTGCQSSGNSTEDFPKVFLDKPVPKHGTPRV